MVEEVWVFADGEGDSVCEGEDGIGEYAEDCEAVGDEVWWVDNDCLVEVMVVGVVADVSMVTVMLWLLCGVLVDCSWHLCIWLSWLNYCLNW